MKRNPRIAAALAVVLVLSGCATVAPGEDKILVRAQQTYETARETANLLFTIEDQHEALLESKLPGTHAVVEKLRVRVREELPKLLRAIDAYDAARAVGKNDLLTALAVAEEFLDELQGLLGKVTGIAR